MEKPCNEHQRNKVSGKHGDNQNMSFLRGIPFAIRLLRVDYINLQGSTNDCDLHLLGENVFLSSAAIDSGVQLE